MSRSKPLYALPTRDPVSGGEFIVTRLECPTSGVVLEGHFSLGWIGRLSSEQLEFVGLLLRHRGNLQRLAPELGVAYNTARNRMEEIVTALGGTAEPVSTQTRQEVLKQLSAGEIEIEEALARLKHE